MNYGEKLKIHDAYVADHPHLYSNVVELLESQVGNSKSQPSSIEDDSKKKQ